MTTAELRRGNLIIGEQGLVYAVKEITEHEIRCVADIDHADVKSSIEIWLPIPLTEEWLLKLGFTIHSTSDWWTKYLTSTKTFMITRYNQDSSEAGIIAGEFYWNESFREIKFVHRLQNLVYELTDKELVVIN